MVGKRSTLRPEVEMLHPASRTCASKLLIRRLTLMVRNTIYLTISASLPLCFSLVFLGYIGWAAGNFMTGYVLVCLQLFVLDFINFHAVPSWKLLRRAARLLPTPCLCPAAWRLNEDLCPISITRFVFGLAINVLPK